MSYTGRHRLDERQSWDVYIDPQKAARGAAAGVLAIISVAALVTSRNNQPTLQTTDSERTVASTTAYPCEAVTPQNWSKADPTKIDLPMVARLTGINLGALLNGNMGPIHCDPGIAAETIADGDVIRVSGLETYFEGDDCFVVDLHDTLPPADAVLTDIDAICPVKV